MHFIQPIGLLKVIQILDRDTFIGDDWMVSRQFSKDGKTIYVKGFGRTRGEAMLDYEAELELEKEEE